MISDCQFPVFFYCIKPIFLNVTNLHNCHYQTFSETYQLFKTFTRKKNLNNLLNFLSVHVFALGKNTFMFKIETGQSKEIWV